MSSNKKYWKSVEELNENSSIVETLKNNEFVEAIPTDEFLGDAASLSSSSTTRRDFLKYVGFSTAAATLAACEGPVHKSIPYVVQPEQIIPGIADFYATTMFDGFDFANLLVKTREGRPIKIDNNKIEGAKFAANARVHASVLSLYDSMRLKSPMINQKNANWTEVDAKIKSSLADAKAKGGQVVLLTNTLASPSTEKLIADFLAKNPNSKHVIYDAVSESAALDAFETVYGQRALVDYDFSKANTIVSIGADFLGDWQGGSFDSGYAKGRIPQAGKMSKHIQFEANMTLSGAAADKRVAMSVANQKQALVKIYNVITGSSIASSLGKEFDTEVTKAAKQLQDAGSKGVLVSGIQDKNAQLLVIAINQVLASEAFSTTGARQIRKGSNEKVAQLIADLNAGTVHTLIMSGVNPVYTLANSEAFISGLKKTKLSVAFSLKEDETASITTIAAAVPHYLESWNDHSLTAGTYSLTQPTIRPLFNTKQFQDVLLSLNGAGGTFYDYLKVNSGAFVAGTSWNKVVHDGIFVGAASTVSGGTADYASAANALSQAKPVAGFELVLYTKTGLGDGQQANNPWLQEFPDPITRVSWDNYLTVSKADAEELKLGNEIVANGGLNGSYATVKVGKTELKVPVIIQPGQAKGTVGLSLGYGRKAALKEEMQVGVNAYVLYNNFDNVQAAQLVKADGEHEFASVQSQKTLMGRGDIVKETTLAVYKEASAKGDIKAFNAPPMVSLDHKEVEATKVDLWESFDRSVGHHFNLSIDLNACTGCGACVIACHAENNVPVVGKDEVRRSRDMHWLRIDRYYSSEDTFAGDNKKKEEFDGLTGDKGSLSGFGEMEDPSDNPQVVFQPVMCQHCNHAPCETVCPVAATSHGRQGQNQMAYNRCVGTRYCANNCPYKVRRFNWFLYNNNDEFNFHMNDDLGRMVINPDVNVRSRGVMEKCSLCIQMTQKTILTAKREGREVKADEFETACSAACSSGAMIFGDVNNTEDAVTKLAASDRSYHLLEHVGTKPNVVYQVKVRNV
ncbi:TAT-variant-translocated molybdopterin oxidoreductase [Flavobacterium aquatile]|uniref:Quinol:cytochrome C oxidoreductase n=1 Tax=Flavobacterium aquatile LMG 4008 = ATCC 11947 TaxID=1453498 RepID=A0A095SX89_9FLAO|nr:TAT-variant-translocated molybdopterin oxidoreductase [Flavobacterium aquatile]KGD69167.1 quinol:cytochrome C oxidoreductase [Flavobacterium aquatile LMG 4008 = ATCC 11947]OXA65874.1 quinol:cytochrome C oxidoreductase [Flavobacterium aquatile LMG 4008 = ATCC 11947]GEC79667.1 quinol:cytochrome C oxidoreductase [Flavobacterium aquatile]